MVLDRAVWYACNRMAAEKNPAAVELGRLGGRATMKKLSRKQRVALAKSGGLVGGKARAKKLTAKQRREIAMKAARARWKEQAT